MSDLDPGFYGCGMHGNKGRLCFVATLSHAGGLLSVDLTREELLDLRDQIDGLVASQDEADLVSLDDEPHPSDFLEMTA